MNAQQQAWAGEFGDSYLARNRVDWRARVPFWKAMIEATGARSVYELGCNAGWNLSAIRRAYPDVQVRGCDINESAVMQACCAGHEAIVKDAVLVESELVFTAGVLIHVSPESLPDVMKMIVAMSTDYVLAIEYAAPSEEQVEYRGNKDMLWKRNYGALYMDMGLDLVQKGPAGKGFDDCTYWLLRKPAVRLDNPDLGIR